MSTQINTTHSTIIPSLRYRDALAAIEWLVTAFGFKKQAVYLGPDNKTVMHAQLTYGGGMIMLASLNDSPYSRLMKQPDEIGGAETWTINLIVSDADAVYARAKAAGAEILFDIEDKHYGGRGFSCRDLEGRIWNVGTYDPWQPKSAQPE